MQPLSSYTLADPKVMQNPYPYYERLRAEDPVHFDEGIRTWLVTRHEDIVAVARDAEAYSDEMRVSGAIRSPFQAEVNESMEREGFLLLDPADSFKIDGELHTRRRKLVAPAFTGPAVAAMEARVAAICRDKAAAFLDRAEADLVREYAMPIPILVICDALGLPMDRVDEVSRGADSMVAQVGAGATREEAYQHARNVMQLQRFTRQAIEERRLKPGSDLISLLAHARIDDSSTPQLNDRELLSIATVAIAGGVDTTRNGIAFALHALATRPDVFARLRTSQEQDKDLRRFHEEVLRFYSPVPQLPRIAKKESVLGGKTIPQGAFVFLCWASGNRDAQRFAEPDKFDLDRTNTHQHLAFGTGVHFCLGAMLARQEMKCAVRQIVNSVESLELAVPADQLDLSTSMVILRGLKSLPVRFRTRDPVHSINVIANSDSIRSTVDLESMPSTSFEPITRDKRIMAGIVNPILARAEPNARFRLVCNRLWRAALSAARPSGSSTMPAIITPTTALGAPKRVTVASRLGARLCASATTVIRHSNSKNALAAASVLLGDNGAADVCSSRKKGRCATVCVKMNAP